MKPKLWRISEEVEFIFQWIFKLQYFFVGIYTEKKEYVSMTHKSEYLRIYICIVPCCPFLIVRHRLF